MPIMPVCAKIRNRQASLVSDSERSLPTKHRNFSISLDNFTITVYTVPTNFPR